MPSSDEVRAAQRAAWAGLSTSWAKWDAVITAQLAPVGDAMIDRLGLRPDQHHLDIASGTGEPGLTIARRVPEGTVVLTDLSAEMLEVARRRAQAQGVDNVEVRVCSADDLPFGDGTFDSPQFYTTGTTPFSVAVADFNGDGLPDVATANWDSNDVRVHLHASGSDTTPPTITARTPTANATNVSVTTTVARPPSSIDTTSS